MPTHSNRRQFLGASATAAAGLVILKDSRSVGAYPANEKLSIGIIGACGQGGSNARNVAGENLVALCDVDERRADETHKEFPRAQRYVDFRKMLDELHRQLDAVVVSTPDHTHAVAAVAAMKLGKHVYCEKPLTRTVHEARVMRRTALEQKVVTQMGNQGSATEGLRRGVELAWAGAMGELREAHIWLANGDGPKERPQDEPPVPPGLHWDLWLGPAPYRPYHPAYVPGTWRTWRAFGNGGGGDMGCHTSNLAFRALRLDLLWNPDPALKPAAPAVIRVEAQASEIHPETYPRRLVAKFDFPPRGNLPPVKLTWYNGGPKPPKDILLGHIMTEWGCLVKGNQGRGLHFVSVEHTSGAFAQSEVSRLQGPLAHAVPPGRPSRGVDCRLQGRPEAFLQLRHRRADDRNRSVGPRCVAGRKADRIRSAERPDRQRAGGQRTAPPPLPIGLDLVKNYHLFKDP